LKNITLLASWGFEKAKGKYYCPSMHYLYIKYIVTIFAKVYLITPVKNSDNSNIKKTSVDFENLEIIEMPFSKGYIDSLKNKNCYKKAIKELNNKVDLFYCRVPDPFSWMPAKYTDKPTIMHFVGGKVLLQVRLSVQR